MSKPKTLEELTAEIAELEQRKETMRENTTEYLETQIALVELKGQRQKRILSERLKTKKAQDEKAARAKRTHEICVLGGILKLWRDDLTEAETYDLIRYLIAQDARGGWASRSIHREPDMERDKEVLRKINHDNEPEPEGFGGDGSSLV